MKRSIIYLFVFLLLSLQANAQQNLEKTLKGYQRPDELITLSSNLPFSKAIMLLSKVSEMSTGKRIVSTVESAAPIGVEITNMPYDKALTIIVQYAGLTYETKEDVVIVKKRNEDVAVQKDVDKYANINSREVKISAVFFEMDVNTAKTRGIDWKFLLSGRGVNIGAQFGIDQDKLNQQNSGGTGGGTGGTGSTTQIAPEYKVFSNGVYQVGNFTGDATAAFKFFENENLGEIIASPNITVRDGKKGRIQVGSDFSIKQRDFSGNIIENFFSTGSIIEVTPYVYNEDNTDYVMLDISVERSSFIPDQLTTEIRKTAANTQVLMLNNEETIIGGLYINDETVVRNGIPFLKDLPWWVFGLRYIFGSDETRINKKELVILIKTELVPTLKNRLDSTKSNTPIKDEINNYKDKVKQLKSNLGKE
ncbi:MAG TPA: hypothetical protein VFF33_04465 [Ignavibacteriaceae bacterium]|nr:hypothetical protein [Ignavibacteriaceae bacterium]